MVKKSFSEQDKAFYKDGYQLGSWTANNPDKNTLFKAIQTMYKSIDQLTESLRKMATREGVTIDCKKACSWCCHQAAFANSYEIDYLVQYIENQLSPNDKNRIIQQAKAKNTIVKSLSEKEILNYKHPCPLLKDDLCSAYESRPMACRIYFSKKLSSCIEFYKNPENRNNYPALLDFPLRAGRMMNEGFTAALKQNGTFTREFRIEEGLELFFSKQ